MNCGTASFSFKVIKFIKYSSIERESVLAQSTVIKDFKQHTRELALRHTCSAFRHFNYFSFTPACTRCSLLFCIQLFPTIKAGEFNHYYKGEGPFKSRKVRNLFLDYVYIVLRDHKQCSNERRPGERVSRGCGSEMVAA